MNIETLANPSTEEQAILNGWHDERALTGEAIDQMVEAFKGEGK